MRTTRTQVAVVLIVVRLFHGIVLTYSALMCGWLFVAVLEAKLFRGMPMGRAPEYLVLYAGWLASHVFIAWHAWRRFDSCSLLTSLILYGIWLIFFVWHGWFTEWAPFRLHEVLMPGYERDEYISMLVQAAFPAVGLALFPLLRFVLGDRKGAD